MKWIFLSLAILFEVASTTSMKLSFGFTKSKYSILTFIFLLLSTACLGFAIKKMQVSVAYALWSGIGMMLIVAIDFYFFKEQLGMDKIIGITFIIIGIVVLNLNMTK